MSALLIIALVCYFIPAIVASIRKHNNATAIFVFNLFLGWTFLGWVLALGRACADNVKHSEARRSSRQRTRRAPQLKTQENDAVSDEPCRSRLDTQHDQPKSTERSCFPTVSIILRGKTTILICRCS